jgi:predicted  nucleic acid-binding Zn-ribbon protein
MSESLNFFRLQKLDTSIDKIKIRIKEIDRILNDDENILAAQRSYDEAEAKAKEIRISLNQVEDKLEATRIKRKTSQTALFSGRIKNPKELQDLQMETEALKNYIAQLEDQQLEIMFDLEEAEKVRQEKEKFLKQTKGKSITENAALLGEKSGLETDLEKFKRERKAVVNAISPDLLSLYKNLRKVKRGIAIASLSEGSCSICGQAITPADLQTIRSSSEIVYCPSCGRMLFGE